MEKIKRSGDRRLKNSTVPGGWKAAKRSNRGWSLGDSTHHLFGSSSPTDRRNPNHQLIGDKHPTIHGLSTILLVVGFRNDPQAMTFMTTLIDVSDGYPQVKREMRQRSCTPIWALALRSCRTKA